VGASTPFLRPLFMASSKAIKHGFGTALVGSSASGSGSGEVTACSDSEVACWVFDMRARCGCHHRRAGGLDPTLIQMNLELYDVREKSPRITS
jgi:hypothetical protein